MSSARTPARKPTIEVPRLFSQRLKIGENHVRQIVVEPQEIQRPGGSDEWFALSDGRPVRLVGEGEQRPEGGLAAARPGPRAALLKWLQAPAPDDPEEVRESYVERFRFPMNPREELERSLREPQTGAFHAIAAHWTSAPHEPATVVMPTGTGKTEVMLALFAYERPGRLLVLVPLRLLRDQIAEKFETLGVLPDAGIVDPRVRRPVVGRVEHGFADADEARAYLSRCNVVIATPRVLTSGRQEVLDAVADACTHLFLDEAHHAAASTWTLVKERFGDRRTVQFTATPFREDRRRIGGRIVYDYPLRRAFDQGYFRSIQYRPVPAPVEGDQDRAVAERAVQALREDLGEGHDHVLLARTDTKKAAERLVATYRELADDLGVAVLHDGVGKRQRDQAFGDLAGRRVRVVVCVDMVGEGFDFPNLKVAALHAPHQSLGPTLQFVGRFARTGDDVGDVTVVAPRADPHYDENLRRLYAREADWNAIITELSAEKVDEERDVGEFEARFAPPDSGVAPQSLAPRMSAVVYSTRTNQWRPDGVEDVFPPERTLTDGVVTNPLANVLWFVTRQPSRTNWSLDATIQDVEHHLYILYLDDANGLLYLYSSDKSKVHEDLAQAVCEDATRIKGETVYRAMHDIARPVPTNVGVIDVLNRSRRFSMHAGPNVAEGFAEGEAETKYQTNVFVIGYENGERRTMGTSQKGRVWSYQAAYSVKEWIGWCDHIGPKLLDETIEPTRVKDGFVRPALQTERPPYVPLALGWPEDVHTRITDELVVSWDEHEWPLVDCDLVLHEHRREGPIKFDITGPERSSTYVVRFDEEGMQIEPLDCSARVSRARGIEELRDFLAGTGVSVFFEDEAVVEPPGVLLRPKAERDPYPTERLTDVDWSGINFNKESRGIAGQQDSVQQRAHEYLLETEDWQVVVDDDGPGEIADLVAVRRDQRTLHVALVHCKYSGDERPGSRVDDLYELCGQAQKSVEWRRAPEKMLKRLRQRQARRDRRDAGGLLLGTVEELLDLQENVRLLDRNFRVVLAQPGLSRQHATEAILNLLASTEMYLKQSANTHMDVWCSP